MKISIVGFGSQGKAWAECLRASGWEVRVYLARKSTSFERAESLGFSPRLISELRSDLEKTPGDANLVAMLCPDSETASIYRNQLQTSPASFTLVLAHGFAVYSDDLKPEVPQHRVALFAPKAIGPKLEAGFRQAREAGRAHDLVAGIHFPEAARAALLEMARGMGFAEENLVEATFDEETIGDLISEQGLLCGGVFTLLQWTLECMDEAGVPDGLIREECFRELELIAGLVHERGPASTLRLISQAALAGTVLMRERLENSGAKEQFRTQVRAVLNKKFAEAFRNGEWKPAAERLTASFQKWEDRLMKGPKA